MGKEFFGFCWFLIIPVTLTAEYPYPPTPSIYQPSVRFCSPVICASRLVHSIHFDLYHKFSIKPPPPFLG